MNGPGKYDDLCTHVRELAEAEFVIVIVKGGKAGGGFSVQAADRRDLVAMPSVLRHVADEIEKDVRGWWST